MIIDPGVGIRSVVELGMPLSEVRRRISNVEVRGIPDPDIQGYVATIRPIGVGFDGFLKGDQVVSGFIEIYTQPPPSAPEMCFKGKLSNGIVFSEGTHVSREEIVKFFGEPATRVDYMDSASIHTGLTNGPEFTIHDPAGNEIMYFVHDGIAFDIQGGVVSRILIYAKVEEGE